MGESRRKIEIKYGKRKEEIKERKWTKKKKKSMERGKRK